MSPAFVLIVHLQSKPSSVDEVKSKLSEYAAKYRTDEGTLGWYVHQDVKDPTKFSIIERYTSKAALKAHTANPAYKLFGPWVQPHLVSAPQILMYNELPVGVPNFESKL